MCPEKRSSSHCEWLRRHNNWSRRCVRETTAKPKTSLLKGPSVFMRLCLTLRGTAYCPVAMMASLALKSPKVKVAKTVSPGSLQAGGGAGHGVDQPLAAAEDWRNGSVGSRLPLPWVDAPSMRSSRTRTNRRCATLDALRTTSWLVNTPKNSSTSATR